MTTMLIKLWLVLAAFVLLSACDADAVNSSLPQNVQLGADAITARQTYEAASARSNALSAQATAVRQSTRDAQDAKATDAAIRLAFANVTETAAAAAQQRIDVQKTESARAGATFVASRAQATETAHAIQREDTATAIAFSQTVSAGRLNATGTAEMAQATRAAATSTAESQAIQAAATQTAIAVRAEADAYQASVERTWAPVNALRGTIVLVCGMMLLALVVCVATFFGIRWYMQWEQNQRLIPTTRGYVVILPGNVLGGQPKYQYLEQTNAPALPEPQHIAGAEIVDDMDEMVTDMGDLESRALNLDALPHALALPLGMTNSGARYQPLSRITHALIAGPSGSGKTTLLHGFAVALLHLAVPQRLVELWLYDGKQGMKFERYKRLGARYVSDQGLARALAELIGEMARRYELFRRCGADSFAAFNLRDTGQLPHIVFIIDELKAALESKGALDQILKLMKEGREAGIHLIMATQFVEAKAIPNDIRGNADTRIAYAVPTVHNSLAILGSSGAEQLPKVPGRFLLDVGNERVEIQGFTVTPPAQAAAAAPSQFTDLEKQMLSIAVREGGWFKTKLIASELGIDDSKVTETAQAWEGRGWLSVDKFNIGRKGKNGRAVLGNLVALGQKEGLVPPGFMSPLEKGVGDMTGTRGDMVGKAKGVVKKATISA